MKFVKYSLLLLVLMVSVSAASADHVHSFTGVHDENYEDNPFLFNSFVNDQVTYETEVPMSMLFVWKDPSGDRRQMADVSYIGGDSFSDTYYPTDEEGTWKVIVEEYSGMTYEEPVHSEATFEVAQLPEFSFVAVVFGLAGFLYLLMRQKMLGSLNNACR